MDRNGKILVPFEEHEEDAFAGGCNAAGILDFVAIFRIHVSTCRRQLNQSVDVA